MRRVWCTLFLLGAILGHAGCKNDALLRPPKPPETFNIPPDEARYVNPPNTPKEQLNNDAAKGKGNDPGNPGTIGKTGRNGMNPNGISP
jgi:hypothetical protein